MNSISARLLIASALVLSLFFILTALSLEHSVHSRAEEAQKDRMKGLIYGVIGAADLDDQGELNINASLLPDLRLLKPQSGMGVLIFDSNNKIIWRSESAKRIDFNTMSVETGQWRFYQKDQDRKVQEFSLRFGFSWTDISGNDKDFNILFTADATDHYRQLDIFDRNLWASLISSALLLLLLQLYVLMWGLKPLSKISAGLRKIQAGESQTLDTKLPIELKPVANSINALLNSEQNRRKRYKNVMNDLAHSLKTPLSILLNLSNSNAISVEHKQTLNEQSLRMKDIIAYHIKRASAHGGQPLGHASAIKPIIDRLSNTLKKVYAQNDISFNNQLDSKLELRLDKGDLMEIFGNLLENACKYGASKILIHSKGNTIYIDDNGPGFPEGAQEELLKRGTRADTRVDGQGLGLSVSNELLGSYNATLEINNKGKLKGARVKLKF